MFLKFIVFEIKIDKHQMEQCVRVCKNECAFNDIERTFVSQSAYNTHSYLFLAVNEYVDAALMYRIYIVSFISYTSCTHSINQRSRIPFIFLFLLSPLAHSHIFLLLSHFLSSIIISLIIYIPCKFSSQRLPFVCTPPPSISHIVSNRHT